MVAQALRVGSAKQPLDSFPTGPGREPPERRPLRRPVGLLALHSCRKNDRFCRPPRRNLNSATEYLLEIDSALERGAARLAKLVTGDLAVGPLRTKPAARSRF